MGYPHVFFYQNTWEVVNRLKELVPMIVLPYQIWFFSDCSIHQYIIVAQETVHSMKHIQGKQGFLSLSLI